MFSGENPAPSVTDTQENTHSMRQEEKVSEISSVKTTTAGSFGTLILIATIIALVGTGALYLYKTQRETKLNSEISRYNRLTDEINSNEFKKLASDLQEIKDGSAALDNAMNNRVYWSKFWSRLSEVTPKNIYLSSLSIDSSNTVTLSGTAQDLTTIAKYMVSLKKSPLFNNIKLGNTSVKDQNSPTAFNLNFTINPTELLDKNGGK